MPADLAQLEAWSARGWKVFPCHTVVDGVCSCGDNDCDSPGKHPRISNGVKGATSNLAQLTAWLAMWPDANWALATGEPSGVWVLDIDRKPGKPDGVESFKEWLDQTGATMYATLVVYSGGNGLHYYFQHEPALSNRTGWRPGVDVKTTGGYVLLPGSTHISGGIYTLASDAMPALADERLIDALKKSAPGTGSTSMIAAISTDELLQGIPEGARDDMLFRLACRLRRQLGDNRAGVTLLVLAAAANSSPPFPEAEALRKVEQAFQQDHSDGIDPFAVGGVEFWNRRPFLSTLYTNARRRRVSPWGALGGAIQRVLHVVPYFISYESDFGRASLNTGIITAGSTGGGKGQTQTLLDDMLRWETFLPIDFAYMEPGSGEGLVDAFAHIAGPKDPSGAPPGELVWENDSHARLAYFDEVGKLAALSSRDGATIFEYVKSGVSGEPIGRKLAGGRGTMLPKRQYRLGLTINVQPKAAGSLLSPAQIAGGFPSRFIWFSTEDATMGTTPRGSVDTVRVRMPEFADVESIRALPEMDEAHDRDQLAAHSRDRDPMDSHALLSRAKVAVGLMALDGRAELNAEDWELSGTVMEHSRATRAHVLAELASEGVKEEQRQARSAARRQTFTEAEKRERDVQRIAKAMQAWKAEGVPQSEWRRRIRSSERDLYREALAAMGE